MRFLRKLEAIVGLKMPLVSVICLSIIGGCSDSRIGSADRVILSPGEVNLGLSDAPVSITASFAPGPKSSMAFDSWANVRSEPGFTITIADRQSNPTTLTVALTSPQPAHSDMYGAAASISYHPCVSAHVKSESEDTDIPECLTINVIDPLLKVSAGRYNRNRKDTQTSEPEANVRVEILNNPKQVGYVIQLVPLSAVAQSCTSTVNCTARRIGFPAITGQSTTPSTMAYFDLKQTVKVNAPETLGSITWSLMAVATAPDGKILQSAPVTIQF